MKGLLLSSASLDQCAMTAGLLLLWVAFPTAVLMTATLDGSMLVQTMESPGASADINKHSSYFKTNAEPK